MEKIWTDEMIKNKLKEYFNIEGFNLNPGSNAPADENNSDQFFYTKALLDGKDVLAVMPTGSGKSLCYQLAGLLIPGVTIVIQPIVALVHDQVRKLWEKHIPAVCIDRIETDEAGKENEEESGATEDGVEEDSFIQPRNRAYYKIYKGEYKFVFVTPERFSAPHFITLLKHIEVGLLVFDEVHCLSLWGHDFRRSYLDAVRVLRCMDKRPQIAAFTATATPEVKVDIIRLLANPKLKVGWEALLKISRNDEDIISTLSSMAEIKGVPFTCRKQRSNYNSNLRFEHIKLNAANPENTIKDLDYVRQWDYKSGYLLDILRKEHKRHIEWINTYGKQDFAERRNSHQDISSPELPCGIIFCETVVAVKYVMKELKKLLCALPENDPIRYYGYDITDYYGPMDRSAKHRHSNDFIDSKAKLMVATNAYGMGVDKENIRFIIHYNIPRCIENYVQECGRAGRDRYYKGICYLLYAEWESKGFMAREFSDDGSIRGSGYVRDKAKFLRMCKNAELTYDDQIKKDLDRYFTADTPLDDSACTRIERAMLEEDLLLPPELYVNSCMIAGRIRKGWFDDNKALKISGLRKKEKNRMAKYVIKDLLSLVNSEDDLADKLGIGKTVMRNIYFEGGRHANSRNYPSLRERAERAFGVSKDFFKIGSTDIAQSSGRNSNDNYVRLFELSYKGRPYTEISQEDKLSFFDCMVADAVYTLDLYNIPIYTKSICKILSGDPEISITVSKSHGNEAGETDKKRLIEASLQKMMDTDISIRLDFSNRQGLYYGSAKAPEVLSGQFLPLEKTTGHSGYTLYKMKETSIKTYVPIGCNKGKGKEESLKTEKKESEKKISLVPPLYRFADMLFQYFSFPLDALSLKGINWRYRKIWEALNYKYKDLLEAGVKNYKDALIEECSKYLKKNKDDLQGGEYKIIKSYERKIMQGYNGAGENSDSRKKFPDSPEHSPENMILAFYLIYRIKGRISPERYNKKSIGGMSSYISFYPESKKHPKECMLDFLFRNVGNYGERLLETSYADRKTDPFFERNWKNILSEKYTANEPDQLIRIFDKKDKKQKGKTIIGKDWERTRILKALANLCQIDFDYFMELFSKNGISCNIEKLKMKFKIGYQDSFIILTAMGNDPEKEPFISTISDWTIDRIIKALADCYQIEQGQLKKAISKRGIECFLVNKEKAVNLRIEKVANKSSIMKAGTVNAIMSKLSDIFPIDYYFQNSDVPFKSRLYIERRTSFRLKPYYPMIYISSVSIEIRELSDKSTFYFIFGYDEFGTREILSFNYGRSSDIPENEYWSSVFEQLKKRGAKEIQVILSHLEEASVIKNEAKKVYPDIDYIETKDIFKCKAEFDNLVKESAKLTWKEKLCPKYMAAYKKLLDKFGIGDEYKSFEEVIQNQDNLMQCKKELTQFDEKCQKRIGDNKKAARYLKDTNKLFSQFSEKQKNISDFGRNCFNKQDVRNVYGDFQKELNGLKEKRKQWKDCWDDLFNGLFFSYDPYIRKLAEFPVFSEEMRYPDKQSAYKVLSSKMNSFNRKWKDSFKRKPSATPVDWADIINALKNCQGTSLQ